MSDFAVQEEKEHYFSGYDDAARFVSYFHQIDLVRKLKPKTVLEIGIGNGTVANYLKAHGYSVTTCDHDKALNPDIVADIGKLPFDDETFDVVVASQILEHLPWDTIDDVMKEMARVSKRGAVISIPYSRVTFEMILKFPYIEAMFKRPYIDAFFGVPHFYKKNEGMRSHEWEMGRHGTELDTVREKFENHFIIKK